MKKILVSLICLVLSTSFLLQVSYADQSNDGIVDPVEILNAIIPSDFAMIILHLLTIVFLVTLVGIPFFFLHKKHQSRLALCGQLVERGAEIPEALLDPSKQKKAPRSDLHRGIILLCLGLSLGPVLFLLSPDTAYWALGLIPVMLGLGYFISAKLHAKRISE